MAAKYKSEQLVPGFTAGYLQLVKKVRIRAKVPKGSKSKLEPDLSSPIGATSKTRRGVYTTASTTINAWICICECGKKLTVPQARFLHNTPKEHCGCKVARGGLCADNNQEYRIWNAMIKRCHDEKSMSYRAYGAKGIRVCDAWRGEKGFETFLADMGSRPSGDYSLDRIDVLAGYFPGNVRWATAKQQARNKKNTIRVPHPKTGRMVAVADLAEELGISYHKLCYQLQKEGKWPYK